MDDLSESQLPDGIVLLPRAGGYTAEEMIEQNKLVNRERAVAHASRQIKNITFSSAVTTVSSTLQGIMEDWNNSKDHSLKKLFLSGNRLQGIGLLTISLALGGLVIDAVL